MSLKDAAGPNFKVGSAIRYDAWLNDTSYKNFIKGHFNQVTFENELKFGIIKPNENDPYDFSKARAMMDWCEAEGIEVRGHTLLWYGSLPQWVKTFLSTATRPQAVQFMKDHILAVFTAFPEIKVWDVVNEVIHPSFDPNVTEWFRTGLAQDNDPWCEAIGPDWIEIAFKYCKELRPDAKLYLNDYNIYFNNAKLNRLINVVRHLKDDHNTPIDGVGIQCHTKGFEQQHFQNIALAFNMLDDQLSDCDLAITEFDCQIGPTDLPIVDWARESLQGNVTFFIANEFLSTLNKKEFTLWHFRDDITHVPGQEAHIVRMPDNILKQNYAVLHELLGQLT